MYPSISKELLTSAIEFAKGYTEISETDIETIFHARKTLLFANDSIWVKRSDPDGAFDVAMGAYDSADICDLVGLYILDTISKKFPSFKYIISVFSITTNKN